MAPFNDLNDLDDLDDLVVDPLAEPAPLASPVDVGKIEKAVREILEAIGEDPDRDGLRNTPSRVARMYAETCAGLHEDPTRHLKVTFEANHDEMILVRDIPFYSLCEHHLVPFFGHAHVGYIPSNDGQVTGSVEAGPPGRGLLPPPAGSGAADLPGRERRGEHPPARGVRSS